MQAHPRNEVQAEAGLITAHLDNLIGFLRLCGTLLPTKGVAGSFSMLPNAITPVKQTNVKVVGAITENPIPQFISDGYQQYLAYQGVPTIILLAEYKFAERNFRALYVRWPHKPITHSFRTVSAEAAATMDGLLKAGLGITTACLHLSELCTANLKLSLPADKTIDDYQNCAMLISCNCFSEVPTLKPIVVMEGEQVIAMHDFDEDTLLRIASCLG